MGAYVGGGARVRTHISHKPGVLVLSDSRSQLCMRPRDGGGCVRAYARRYA